MVLHVMQQSVKWHMLEGSGKGRPKVHLFWSLAVIHSRCLEKFRNRATREVVAHILSQSLPICRFLSQIIPLVTHVNFSSEFVQSLEPM